MDTAAQSLFRNQSDRATNQLKTRVSCAQPVQTRAREKKAHEKMISQIERALDRANRCLETIRERSNSCSQKQHSKSQSKGLSAEASKTQPAHCTHSRNKVIQEKDKSPQIEQDKRDACQDQSELRIKAGNGSQLNNNTTFSDLCEQNLQLSCVVEGIDFELDHEEGAAPLVSNDDGNIKQDFVRDQKQACQDYMSEPIPSDKSKNLEHDQLEALRQVDGYVSNLWKEQRETKDLRNLKAQFRLDLEEVIKSQGRNGKHYVHHFFNDLIGRRSWPCPYCCYFFSSKQARSKHRLAHESKESYIDLSNFPSLRRRWYSCIVCGSLQKGSIPMRQHLELCHSQQERIKFGVASVNHLQYLVLKVPPVTKLNLNLSLDLMSRARTKITTIKPEHLSTVRPGQGLHLTLIRGFMEALRFDRQQVRLVGVKWHLLLWQKDSKEAIDSLQSYLPPSCPETLSLLIPCHEDETWFLLRVDYEERVITQIDPRLNPRRSFFKTTKLLLELMADVKPALWQIMNAERSPKTNSNLDSGVILCLNLLCFAARNPRDDDIISNYRRVFIYEPDAEFLNKGKVMVAQAVIDLIQKQLKIRAEPPMDVKYL